MIEIQDIYKSYGELKVLSGISTSVEKGEVVSIIGPSGTGKSTFLRCINYLEEADKGTISFDGQKFDLADMDKKSIKDLRAHSSMVFQ